MENKESERQFPVFIVKLKVKVSGKRRFPVVIVQGKGKRCHVYSLHLINDSFIYAGTKHGKGRE